jgi:hypothetical protein
VAAAAGSGVASAAWPGHHSQTHQLPPTPPFPPQRIEELKAEEKARRAREAVWFEAGKAAYERGEYPDSVAAFERAVEENGRSSVIGGEALMWLALAYQARAGGGGAGLQRGLDVRSAGRRGCSGASVLRAGGGPETGPMPGRPPRRRPPVAPNLAFFLPLSGRPARPSGGSRTASTPTSGSRPTTRCPRWGRAPGMELEQPAAGAGRRRLGIRAGAEAAGQRRPVGTSTLLATQSPPPRTTPPPPPRRASRPRTCGTSWRPPSCSSAPRSACRYRCSTARTRGGATREAPRGGAGGRGV